MHMLQSTKLVRAYSCSFGRQVPIKEILPVLRPSYLPFQARTRSSQLAGWQGMVIASQPSQKIWENLHRTYHFAEDRGALYRIRTKPEVLHDNVFGLDFVLQIADALRDKPKADSRGNQHPIDAFEAPDEHLMVQDLSATHMLRLNKFNVVPYHSLVITRHFEAQTDPLNEADWSAAWQTVQAYPDGALVYFNCGEDSGASQPRKHLQIVPLLLHGTSTAPLPFNRYAMEAWHRAGSPHLGAAEMRQLPFQSFATVLPARITPGDLRTACGNLMAARLGSSQEASFNVLVTEEFMMLVPRSRGACGPINCNALVFAGTLLVRSTAELDFLRQEGPMRVLTEVTTPWGS